MATRGGCAGALSTRFVNFPPSSHALSHRECRDSSRERMSSQRTRDERRRRLRRRQRGSHGTGRDKPRESEHVDRLPFLTQMVFRDPPHDFRFIRCKVRQAYRVATLPGTMAAEVGLGGTRLPRGGLGDSAIVLENGPACRSLAAPVASPRRAGKSARFGAHARAFDGHRSASARCQCR